MDELNIYFDDLCEETQQKVLEFMGIKNPSDGNYDFCPLFVLTRPEED
ncbi:MAG: hypothetical protein OEV87_01405 [Phycisphaerae bacterium]|nr:hypothetical protein [Phycisphaerae bacterium]